MMIVFHLVIVRMIELAKFYNIYSCGANAYGVTIKYSVIIGFDTVEIGLQIWS